MSTAFQSNAFQNNAFQITVVPPTPGPLSPGTMVPIDDVYGSDFITRATRTIEQPYAVAAQNATFIISAGVRLSPTDVLMAYFTRPDGSVVSPAPIDIAVGTGDVSTVVGRYFGKTYVSCTLSAAQMNSTGIWRVELMVNSSLGAQAAFLVKNLTPTFH